MSESDESEMGSQFNECYVFDSSESFQSNTRDKRFMMRYRNRLVEAYARGEFTQRGSSEDSCLTFGGGNIDQRKLIKCRYMKRVHHVDKNNFHTNWHLQVNPDINSDDPVS